MKNHGPIQKGLSKSDKYFILENENQEFYLVKNQEIFEAASSQQQFTQKIHRAINRTIFFGTSTAELYAYTEEEKNTLSILQNHFTELFPVDDNLKSIVKLCEGADSSDIIKFKYISEILEYKALEDNLSSGLGFPGKGFGLVVAKESFPYSKTIVFMQKVDSYMEGYAVDHYEILPEMVDAIQKGLITIKNFNL